MSAAPHNDKIEDAPRVSGAERGDNESDLKRDEPVLLKSSHDSLGYWATARIFWKVSCLTDNVRGWESPAPLFRYPRPYGYAVQRANDDFLHCIACSCLQLDLHCRCCRWISVHPERKCHCQPRLHQSCWIPGRRWRVLTQLQLHSPMGRHAITRSARGHGLPEPHL